jgi:ketosteroid isomerase-like protein
MNDQQKKEQYSGVRDQEIRAALDQHWAASDANDFETEHRIYHEDAVLEYPQSGERTRGRSNIQNQRAIQPNKKRFSIRRIIGSGELDYFRVWTCASNSTTIPLDCGLHSRL